jgi:hypothetical protein
MPSDAGKKRYQSFFAVHRFDPDEPALERPLAEHDPEKMPAQ